MSQRLAARTGLTAAILTMTLAISVVAHSTFSRAFPHPLEIGRPAPQFTLPDTAGHPVSLADFRGHALVLFFGSDACPCSHKYAARLASLARDYADDPRVQFLAINANTHARASAPSTLDLTADPAAPIPTLLDPMAEVARSFGASVTPTFCVIAPDGTLTYAGSFDDGADAPTPPSRYVARALERTVTGMPIEVTSTQAFGQSIPLLK